LKYGDFVEIRIAQTSDAKKWIDLLISCLGDDYQVKQIYDSEFVSSLLNPKSSEETYIVDVNDELIASITVFKPVEFVNNPVMNIGRILIKPQSLSDGSAKLLFDTIQKIANEQKQNIVACVPAYAYELQVFLKIADIFALVFNHANTQFKPERIFCLCFEDR
jgi:Rad3-related DNA helicase